MKIALFPSAFYPSLGGVEELTLRLAQRLMASGDEVRVFTERWPRNLPEHDVVDGVTVRRLSWRVPDARGIKPKLTWAATRGTIARRLQADLRAFDPDVVHLQCVSSAADYALPVAQRLGVPVVTTLQGELSMDPAGIYRRPGPRRRMVRALTYAAAVTACSAQTLAEAEAFLVERRHPPFGDRGDVIHNGVDLSLFSNVEPYRHPKGRRFVFALGRHVREKGFDVLIDAMPAVGVHGGETIDLVLAGDGPLAGALNRQIQSAGLSDRVHRIGRLSHPKVRACMKAAAAFVLPSRHEPFGIVNLEAMASGTPVVATQVGGVPEFVIDGSTGLLVRPEDAEGLSNALNRILLDSRLAGGLADQAGVAVRRFDWREVANAYQAVYRRHIVVRPASERLSMAARTGGGT